MVVHLKALTSLSNTRSVATTIEISDCYFNFNWVMPTTNPNDIFLVKGCLVSFKDSSENSLCTNKHTEYMDTGLRRCHLQAGFELQGERDFLKFLFKLIKHITKSFQYQNRIYSLDVLLHIIAHFCLIQDVTLIIPPANEVAGVYSDPYVRPSVPPNL